MDEKEQKEFLLYIKEWNAKRKGRRNCKCCFAYTPKEALVKGCCSPLCLLRFKEKQDRRKRLAKVRPCKSCRSLFCPEKRGYQFCSDDCREWARRNLRKKPAKRYDRGSNPLPHKSLNCPCCKSEISYEKSESKSPKYGVIDHIIPRSKGGSNDMSNLHWLCAACNLSKSNKIAYSKSRSQEFCFA